MRTDLIEAFNNGSFLKTVYEKSLENCENSNEFKEELIKLHNQGEINIISSFKKLVNSPESGVNFFITRQIFEDCLPYLEAPILPVMECVLHLVAQAGKDMMAGQTFKPYIDFCSAEPSRPSSALNLIEKDTDEFADLLSPTIVAGTNVDIEYFVDEAIRLSAHQDIEIRKRAIFSLGRIQYRENSTLVSKSLAYLEKVPDSETDDHLLGNLINASFRLFKSDKANLVKVIDLVSNALNKGSDYTIHSAAQIFGLEFDDVPEELMDKLLIHLLKANPANKGTIHEIDLGLARLLKQQNPIKGIEFIETLLITNPKALSLEMFKSSVHELSGNLNVLNKMMTRWFLRGTKVLCEGIEQIISQAHNKDFTLSIDQSELDSTKSEQGIFIARKTIGYIILNPVTIASIIISLMKSTDNDAVIDQLSDLLYDPVLINFPGKTSDYLKKQIENEHNCKIKLALEKALKSLDNYFNELESVGNITELYPSQSQRETYHRRNSMQMSHAMKESEKESVFLSLASKSVILYGRKSINYIEGMDGQSNRMEIPLQNHSVEIEFPRLARFDPFGFDLMLRTFRVEQLNL